MNEKFTEIPLVQDKEVEMLAHQSLYGICFVLKRSSSLLKFFLHYYPELKSEGILIKGLIEDIDQMLGKENTPDKPDRTNRKEEETEKTEKTDENRGTEN